MAEYNARMRAYHHPITGPEAGFSLIQICLLLTVASILVVSVMPGGERGSDMARDALTIERMQKIEEATQAFIAKNLRRPCPSDVTLAASDSNMGVEATTALPDVCYNNTPSASFADYVTTLATGTAGTNTITVTSATGIDEGDYVIGNSTVPPLTRVTDVTGTTITLDTVLPVALLSSSVAFHDAPVVAGGVPTRTLGLPEEYGLDGYGRRIMYAVDIRAATKQGCADMKAKNQQGALSILDGSGEVGDKVMWVLLSYGKKAHGAVGPQGAADLASRFNTGSTDTDTRINAFVDGSFTTSFTGELVRKEADDAFDDVVWSNPEMKNECCVGKRCKLATTIRADSAYYRINGVAAGDINGDGKDDVVMATNNGSNSKRIYVAFGSKIGWPQPQDVLSGASSLGGGNGFWIDQASSVGDVNLIAVGDVNGDGYDDLIIPYTSQSAAVVFGAPTWLTTNPGKGKLTASGRITLSDGYLDGTTGTKISMPHSDNVRQMATGNVDGDAYDDIVLMDDGSSAYVVLGKAEGTWASATSMTSEIYVSGIGDMSIHGLAVGNLNNDAYDDIVLPHGYASTQADILFGRTNWTTNSSWVGDAATVNGSLLALTTELGSAASAVRITNVSFNASPNTTITIGEVTGDAFNDVIIPNSSSVAIYAGSASWPATTSSATVDNSNISSAGPEPIAVGDVNLDGKNDLIIGGTTAAVYFQPSSGFANGTTWALDGSDGFSITNSLTPYTSAYTHYPALADLNYDGLTDVVLGSSGLPISSQARISVVYGKGNGWDASIDLFQP